jgi:hypothetical protein
MTCPDELVVEELRTAADVLVRALDAAGNVLPRPATDALEHLRTAVAATPTRTVLVPMGQPDRDGWVVTPAGRASSALPETEDNP